MARHIYFTIDTSLVASPKEESFNALTVDLPAEFVYSNNKKFVSVNSARCFNVENDVAYDVIGAACCSNIIQDNPYGDYFLTFCNYQSNLGKKIQIYDAKTKFNVWFKDGKGKILDLHPKKHRVVVELLLEF
jgi:hypothetical protein